MIRFLMSALLVVAVYTGTAAAQPSIKLGVVTKPGSAQNIVAEKFKELIEVRSEGEIRVRIYHSKSIGNETEILQQVQMNTVQMAIITAGPFDTFDPIVRVVNYPFLFRDHRQADEILDGPLGAEVLKSLEKFGFVGICFSENGFRNLTNSRRPVRTPEDVTGLKIRVMASALHKSVWQQLGANPTPMPWPIYTELEQGVIDGQENPLWVMVEYKLYEVQRHMTLTRHVYSPHISVASRAWWTTLAPGTRQLITDILYEAARFQRRDNRERNAARLAFLRSKGMQIVEAPDTDAFRARVANLQDMEIYRDPRVKDLLKRILAATR